MFSISLFASLLDMTTRTPATIKAAMPDEIKITVSYTWELSPTVIVRNPGGRDFEIVRIFGMVVDHDGTDIDDVWVITTCQGYPLTQKGERDRRSDGHTIVWAVPEQITDPYEDKTRELLVAQIKAVS